MPANPAGWLVTTARNRAIDRIRRARTLAEKTRLLDVPEAAEDEMDELDQAPIADERLELIFTCCHPALATDAQVALTLRALGGLSTEEIARAFLVSEETMKRRLSRAKAKIKATEDPVLGPVGPACCPTGCRPCSRSIYLIYNEGYGGRVDLAGEAIRLGRVLVELMPDEPEVHGLLALMMLHHARREARFAGEDLVLLADQDRSLWDAEEVAHGRELLDRAIALRGRGAVRDPGGDRLVADPGGDRLAPGRGALRAAAPSSPARRSSSSIAPWRSPRPARPSRRSRWSSSSTSTNTATCTPRAASCCGGSAGRDEARAGVRPRAGARKLRARASLSAAAHRRALSRRPVCDP